MQQDPIKDGANWYLYSKDNPLIGIDPTGRISFDVCEFRDCLVSFGILVVVPCAVCARAVVATPVTAGLSSVLSIPSCSVCAGTAGGVLLGCAIVATDF